MAKWNSAEAQFFIERLNTDKIASFFSKIKCLDTDRITESDINNLNAEKSSILLNAAKEAGFIKDIKIIPPKKTCILKTKSVQRPWFDNKC